MECKGRSPCKKGHVQFRADLMKETEIVPRITIGKNGIVPTDLKNTMVLLCCFDSYFWSPAFDKFCELFGMPQLITSARKPNSHELSSISWSTESGTYTTGEFYNVTGKVKPFI